MLPVERDGTQTRARATDLRAGVELTGLTERRAADFGAATGAVVTVRLEGAMRVGRGEAGVM
ncbi:MAG: hypothetical protein EB082_15695, partial [Verrucomicrobia bacterium]|nr:hypothetical protein [Verrucomicrobiota bacterium]